MAREFKGITTKKRTWAWPIGARIVKSIYMRFIERKTQE